MGSNQSNTARLDSDPLVWVEFENDWFAQGVSRLAYRGEYRGDPRRDGVSCVVKVYKEQWYERLGEYAWKADDRATTKAQEMARLFNEAHCTSKPIEFLMPEFTNVDTRAAFNFLGLFPFATSVKGKLAGTSAPSWEMIPAGATVAIERYLKGSYEKFLSNTAYVNPNVNASSPVAFSHFTFHASRGTLLVTDLQGVRHKAGYELTDPAVHSIGKKLGYYGPTDMGIYGIIKFFLTHKCNNLCRGLLKPDLSKIPRDSRRDVDRILEHIQSRCATSYTYELLQTPGIGENRVQGLHEGFKLQPIRSVPEATADVSPSVGVASKPWETLKSHPVRSDESPSVVSPGSFTGNLLLLAVAVVILSWIYTYMYH